MLIIKSVWHTLLSRQNSKYQSERCATAADTGTVTAQFMYYGYCNRKNKIKQKNAKDTYTRNRDSSPSHERDPESSMWAITMKDGVRQSTEAPLIGICDLRWHLTPSLWIFSCSVVPYSARGPLYNTNCSDFFLLRFSLCMTCLTTVQISWSIWAFL